MTDELAELLGHTTFLTMGAVTKVAADNDLSLTQLRVLAILSDRRVRMSALAAHLGLDRSTLSGLVDRAAARGLVAREPNSEDGRAIDVVLTRSGHALAVRLQNQVAAALSIHTERLTSADRHRLTVLLGRLVEQDEP